MDQTEWIGLIQYCNIILFKFREDILANSQIVLVNMTLVYSNEKQNKKHINSTCQL